MLTQPDPPLVEIRQGSEESFDIAVLAADGSAMNLTEGFTAETVVFRVPGEPVLLTIPTASHTFLDGAEGKSLRVGFSADDTASLLSGSVGRNGASRLFMDSRVTRVSSGRVERITRTPVLFHHAPAPAPVT